MYVEFTNIRHLFCEKVVGIVNYKQCIFCEFHTFIEHVWQRHITPCRFVLALDGSFYCQQIVLTRFSWTN